jgi:hypothetical protein
MDSILKLVETLRTELKETNEEIKMLKESSRVVHQKVQLLTGKENVSLVKIDF